MHLCMWAFVFLCQALHLQDDPWSFVIWLKHYVCLFRGRGLSQKSKFQFPVFFLFLFFLLQLDSNWMSVSEWVSQWMTSDWAHQFIYLRSWSCLASALTRAWVRPSLVHSLRKSDSHIVRLRGNAASDNLICTMHNAECIWCFFLSMQLAGWRVQQSILKGWNGYSGREVRL